jgi:hypothetical protein
MSSQTTPIAFLPFYFYFFDFREVFYIFFKTKRVHYNFSIIFQDKITIESYKLNGSPKKKRYIYIHDPSKVVKLVSYSHNLRIFAWKDASLPSLWLSPLWGRIKDTFDVAVRDAFVVDAAVISDAFGNIILVATLKLVGSDV